jgi:dTDP-4-dehydrorhamnose reductase
MKSILITGANGQLGTALRNMADAFDGCTLHFTDVDTLDICDRSQVECFMKSRSVDTVVNCAAYTAVDRAEDDPDTCTRINCDAVRNVGEAAERCGAAVIHVSTDYVFDGNATRPYREDDPTGPASVYGATKLAGERALLSSCGDTAVIIRTAWLYSETGSNFVRTMLRLGGQRGSIGVVADQKGTPTYAADLAGAIRSVVSAERFTPGIYNYTNGGVCSWYDFAVEIFRIAGIDCEVTPLATADYPTRAKRPAYSVLDKSKIKETYNPAVPAWEESLRRCLHNLLNK